MDSLSERQLRAVRARIADVVLPAGVPHQLGHIRLHAHQQLAAVRVTRAIEHHGGCLLADDVGRGKTYVALAVARGWERPLVVVPASLRSTWLRATERAAVPAPLITHEALSRGAMPAFEPDGVVVDESHRFRSPLARRHAALARVTAHARVLLLSATPVQNGVHDLAAQLAFFLGSAAWRASEASLARHVIRSPSRADVRLPAVAPPEWLRPQHDDGAVLRAILALPRPARAVDAGDAGALRTIGLVRAWASSRAALAAALRQRRRVATGIEQCAANGLAPTRRDLRAWHGVGGDVQLALAPMLVTRPAGRAAEELLSAVAAEGAALDVLTALLATTPNPDRARVAALRIVRAAHPECRVLAFSELATTVRAYHALLRADAGVGMLTASDARIASGRLPRDALLARFAPESFGAQEPVLRERVTLLLSTDLLSEGVNLQTASVVVHLDLPWNPARLTQRVGRVRRPGGAPLVHSYLMAPPAQAELLLRVDARLRAKLARAERAIGRTLPALPALAPLAAQPAAAVAPVEADVANAELLGRVVEVVARWRRRRAGRAVIQSHGPLVAAITCHDVGWLAALDDGRLVARLGERPPNIGHTVLRVVRMSDGGARRCSEFECRRALRETESWLERERLAVECGLHETSSSLDSAIERRLALVVHRAPRHERAQVLTLGGQLRASLGRTRSLGAERELEELLALDSRSAARNSEWLTRSLAVVSRIPRYPSRERRTRVVALVVLGPVCGEAPSVAGPPDG